MKWHLRPWELSDVPAVALYANDSAIAANLRNVFPYPYTRKDAEAFIGGCMAGEEARQLCRAICVDGHAAGSIGIFRREDVYCKQAEIGYWLARPYWGKGIMSEAVRRMCEEAFAHWDIVRISAEVLLPIPVLSGYWKRMGFEKKGFCARASIKMEN